MKALRMKALMEKIWNEYSVAFPNHKAGWYLSKSKRSLRATRGEKIAEYFYGFYKKRPSS